MKRILLACFLITATCTIGPIQRASAQVTHVTATDFATQVNLLDTYIGAGDMTAAQTTWNTVHSMMLSILGYTKNSIMNAATPADKTAFTDILTNQRTIYQAIWLLKSDLAANRTALHTKLGEFDNTIY